MQHSSSQVSRMTGHLGEGTDKICQVDVALRIEQHVIGFDIPMDDSLLMDISQGTSQLRNPESNCIFRKALSRDVKS
jgi:hypothetical protein